MTARFLITTADERSWRTDTPVLFLGEWCKLHARREVWSKFDSAVVPYHWDDRAKLYADYLYLQDLHERLLQELSGQLNRIHGVDHGQRYWRVLVGPWLGYFAQMLFDRWASIAQAAGQYELTETIVLCGQEHSLIPNDMAGFTRLFVADEWNHHMYAAVIEQFTDVPCRRQERKSAAGESKGGPGLSRKRRAKVALATWYAGVASHFTRDHDAFFLATYLPFRDEMRMHRRLGQVPQLWHFVPPPRVAVVESQRQWAVSGENRSEFEACVRAFIPRQIPTDYLEGYGELAQRAESLPWPKRPKVIWTSNSHIYDDVFKAWAADKVERGSPLIIGQHGGHFGVGRWSFLEDHEIAISDQYLSWGWSDARQPKIRSVGQLKAKRKLGVRHAEQAGALLVTCSLPRFSYWMYSAYLAGQWLDYFEDQCRFVGDLPQRIRDALTVRLFFEDYGWDQAGRWNERFPDVRLENGQSDIDALIGQSRLYISTYNATTFLESFTMDVPTIVYWNENHWERRASADPYFADLKRVGIFHDTPESAALHVARVWDDVGAWWYSPPVQQALVRFKKQYCDLPEDRLERIERVLREAISEADQTLAQ
jgi:putative transferase (TIGR04331 family)